VTYITAKLYQRNRDIESVSLCKRMDVFELISKAKSTIDNERAQYLHFIWCMLEDDNMKIVLAKPESNFLPFLADIVHLMQFDDVTKNALACLWYMSRSYESKFILASQSLDLIPCLIRYLSFPLTEDIEFKDLSFNVLINCSIERRIHDYLLSDEIGYLDYCTNCLLNENDNNSDPYVAIANFVCHISSRNLSFLISRRIHEIILLYLFKNYSCFHVETWNERYGKVYWILNILIDFTIYKESCYVILDFLKSLSMSSFPSTAFSSSISNSFDSLSLVSSNRRNNSNFLSSQPLSYFPSSTYYGQYFYHLLACPDIESLKSLAIICHLSRFDENFENLLPSVLTTFPTVKSLLVLSILCTLDHGAGEFGSYMEQIGYIFGIFSMKVLTNMVVILCRVSDSNLKLLAEYSSKWLFALLDILDLFIDRKPELTAKLDCIETAGGGKDDYDTLVNTLEILYYFVNYFLKLRDEGDTQYEYFLEDLTTSIKGLTLRFEEDLLSIPIEAVIFCKLINEKLLNLVIS
jgi:hypothetical protein